MISQPVGVGTQRCIEPVVSHIVLICIRIVEHGLVGCSQDILGLVFLKQRILIRYVHAAALQTFGSSVIHMIVGASGVIAGPGKVINSILLGHNNRLTEIRHAVHLADSSLFNAHHIVIQFRDGC